MVAQEYRVGELARKAGVTVRTLHHWEDVGLLAPARRSHSGHRLYSGDIIARVQSIRSLKAMGMGLEEIRRALEGDGPDLAQILQTHRARIQEQIRVLTALDGKLQRVLEARDREGRVRDSDLLQVMEAMTVVERYFSPDQLEALAARKAALGPEAIRDAEREWPVLIARVRAEMEKGTNPESPEVQALAGRWRELVQAFSGGDKAIEASLGTMFREEPDMAEEQGLTPELFHYVRRAWEAGK
jgi:DNA-binding transcriptional MerR regulator